MYLHGICQVDPEMIKHFKQRGVYWTTDGLGQIPLGHLYDLREVPTLEACRSEADLGLWDVAGGRPYVRATIKITDETRRATLAAAVNKRQLSLASRRHVVDGTVQYGMCLTGAFQIPAYRLFVGPGW